MLIWTRVCPLCRATLEKANLAQPWVCEHCGWRSDK
jgi:hypothetical protein